MTISSSLNAGVAGLAVNASRLSTISDNIANSATFGYKRAVSDFHSMVVPSGPSRYVAGGVMSVTQRLVDARGPLLSTSNSTDLAVNGRGFLPVTSDVSTEAGQGRAPMLLTSTGSFRPDAEGYLRSTSGLVLLGWPADVDGNVPVFNRDTQDSLVPVRIDTGQFWGAPTTEMRITANLPATETIDGASGTSQELSVQYYDNLGKPERLTVTFEPVVPAAGAPATNQWRLVLNDSASPAGTPVGDYLLTFSGDRSGGGTLQSVAAPVAGGPYDPATGRISINVAGGPIDVDIGLLGSPSGMTQLSDKFAPVQLSKNGSPAANLNSVEVDATGLLRANFDTGTSRTLYKIPLVGVAAPNGLRAMNDQTYQTTRDSGDMFLWDAGDGPTGEIVGYAREESSTDVSVELTQLIQTQRAYTSNAKVIQTVDEMLQETANLKR